MPVIFRRPRLPRKLFTRRFIPGAGAIRIGIGSSAGVGAASAVGRAIKTAVGSTAGSAGVNGVGRAIKATVGVSAGSASCVGLGGGLRTAVGSAAGTSTVDGIKVFRLYTSNRVVQLPVDCVLAGQQELTRKGRAGGRALKRAFGE